MGPKNKTQKREAAYRATRSIEEKKRIEKLKAFSRSQESIEKYSERKLKKKILKSQSTLNLTKNQKDALKRDHSNYMKNKRLENQYQKERKNQLAPEMQLNDHDISLIKLDTFRKMYKNRKTYTWENFQADRSNDFFEACDVCHRQLFIVQADTLLKEKIKETIINELENSENGKDVYENFNEKLILCHRCKNSFNRTGKIPSQAYWNYLNPGAIPEELKNLEPVEVRLISRLIPFMKIIKINGQAALFASDVSEVQSQILNELPRKTTDLGLVIVVESLENVQRQRNFKIRKELVRKALEWLLDNNHLYKDLNKSDIQKNMDNFEPKYDDFCIEAPPEPNEVDDYNIDKWINVFVKKVKIGKILHGQKHFNDLSFGASAGKQGLAMVITSLVRNLFKCIESWDNIDLENILLQGNRLHCESTNEYLETPTAKAMGVILNEVSVDFSTIKKNFTVFDQDIEVAFSKTEHNSIDFLNDVKFFLQNHNHGILQYENIYISIIKHETEYFFFDPRQRGPMGYVCKKRGYAIAMQFDDIEKFLKRLRSQIQFKIKSRFTLSSVIICKKNEIQEKIVSTFGDSSPELFSNPNLKDSNLIVSSTADSTPKLYTNPIFKESQQKCSPMQCDESFETNCNLDEYPDFFTIHASWCQNNSKYRSTTQCTAMAAASLIRDQLIDHIDSWNQTTLNNILDEGNKLYFETLSHNSLSNGSYLSAEQLIPEVILYNRLIKIHSEWKEAGRIHNVDQGIESFFTNNTHGVFTCQGKSYAIFKSNEAYWFFDSHAHNVIEKARLIRLTSQESLVSVLNSNINLKTMNPQFSSFDICSIKTEFSAGIVLDSDDGEIPKDSKQKKKHKLPKLKKTPKEIKKPKLHDYSEEVNTSKPIDTIKIDSENEETMSDDEDLHNRIMLMEISPWKNEEKVLADAIEESKYKCENFRNIQKELNVENIENENNSSIVQQECSHTDNICMECMKDVLYIQNSTHSYRNQRIAQDANINQKDRVFSIGSILNTNFVSCSSWSSTRIDLVLSEAIKFYEEKGENFTNLRNVGPIKLNIFDSEFEIDIEGYAHGTVLQLQEALASLFKSFDYGLLRLNNDWYAVSFINEYYTIFDCHGCNEYGLPFFSDGTPCVIVTKNFNLFTEALLKRVIKPENLDIEKLITESETFQIQAVQILYINGYEVPQRELAMFKKVLSSTIDVHINTKTEKFYSALTAVATDIVLPIKTWELETVSLIQTEVKSLQHQIMEQTNKFDNDFTYNLQLYIENISLSVSIKRDIFKRSTKELKHAIYDFFSNHDRGLININDETFAIIKDKELFCVYDPNSCDSYGNKVKYGSHCAIITSEIDEIIDILLDRDLKHKDSEFTISEVFIDLNKPKQKNIKTKEIPVDVTLFDQPIRCPDSLMRPIDDIVPTREDIFNIQSDDKHISTDKIPLVNITRATKPPVNEFLERRHEELCFPHLFPYGKHGVNDNQDRLPKPSALEYYQSRVMGCDTRFHSREYLLYALNMTENAKIRSSISMCGQIKQNGQNIDNLTSNLHLVMRTIRGSSAYWNNALLDLLAIVNVLGPGTAFITLSCNDLNWDSMLKACLKAEGKHDDNPSKLPLETRLRLIEDHPVIVSRIFNKEVQSFIRLLKNGEALNGWKAQDYWYRIEWQQRGSPHLHLIVWLKDFPKLNSPEGIKAMEELCKCDIPKNDVELADLVKKYQIHRHSETCFKNRKKDDPNKRCRFSFPRQPCKETRVLEIDTTEFLRNGHRIVEMKRPEGCEWVNNYNPSILRNWKANMDFQFITSQAIIAYIAKYSCKAEPEYLSKMISDAIKEARESSDLMGRKLFKVGMKILSQRQVSCCEAANRLCHLPMKGSSRKVEFINTSDPEKRYKLFKIDQKNPENNDYYTNIIERYERRPHHEDLDSLSLAEFAMLYKPHYFTKNKNDEDGDEEFFNDEEKEEEIDDLSNLKITINKPLQLLPGKTKGYIKKRKNPAIFRSRYFSPNGSRVEYFYSLLLLHLPFRAEKEILQKLAAQQSSNQPEYYNSDETEKAFMDKKDLLRPLSKDQNFEEYRVNADEIIRAILQSRALMDDNGEIVEDDKIPTHKPGFLTDTVEDGEIIVNGEDVPNDQPKIITKEDPTKRLNGDQLKLFKLVQKTIQADLKGQNPKQIKIFTTGSAGTGKSFCIEKIIQLINDAYGADPKNRGKKIVHVTAPTGVAARLINGQTLHSTLLLGIEKSKTGTHKKLTGKTLEDQRKAWASVKFLIIDEISMVSNQMFNNIEQRLEELMNNEKPFGGIHILAFGDLMQLKPVHGKRIFEENGAQAPLWKYFDFCELKQNMRQKNDQEFIEILNTLRFGGLHPEQMEVIMNRIEGDVLKREGIFADENATLIAPTKNIVEKHNYNVLMKLTKTTKNNPNPPKLYTFNAIDTLRDNHKQINQPDMEKITPKDINECGGVPKSIDLAIGARVMLRRNISVSQGLVNGSLGKIKNFIWPSFKKDQIEEGDLPESIEVDFDNIGIVNIKPMSCAFDAKQGYGKIERYQIPLILAWGVTAHKMQGVTVDSAVLDLGKAVFDRGQAYVMLSRVRNLDKVLIARDFCKARLEVNCACNKAIAEMERLRNLPLVESETLVMTKEESDQGRKLD